VRVSWLPGVDSLKELDIGEMYNTRKLPSHLYPDACRMHDAVHRFVFCCFFISFHFISFFFRLFGELYCSLYVFALFYPCC
jgi:hypothetical protein